MCKYETWLLIEVSSSGLLADTTVEKMWKKTVIKAFYLVRALLNGYGQEVNGLLIHANRLAFA